MEDRFFPAVIATGLGSWVVLQLFGLSLAQGAFEGP